MHSETTSKPNYDHCHAALDRAFPALTVIAWSAAEQAVTCKCAAGCAIVTEIERNAIDPFAIQDGAKVERKISTRGMVSSSTALGVDLDL